VTANITLAKKMKHSRLTTRAASIHSCLILPSAFNRVRSSSSRWAFFCSRSRMLMSTGSDRAVVLTGWVSTKLVKLSSRIRSSGSLSGSSSDEWWDCRAATCSTDANHWQMILLTWQTDNHIIRVTRNTLDCDQSNYSSRIDFSHISIECGHAGNSAIRSAEPENPTLEPNIKWIGRPLASGDMAIWNFPKCEVVGRSVLNIYTLISYTKHPGGISCTS